MDSETLKIVVFIGVVLAAAAVARSFFGGNSRKDPFAPPTLPETPNPAEEEEEQPGVAAVGAELPFPSAAAAALRQVPAAQRPKIVNYLFRTIDLVNGPADPTDFIDEFIVQTRNEDGSLSTDSLVVATPAALERILREEKRHAIYAARYLVVDRFNIGEILTGWLKSEGTSADRTDERATQDELRGH